MKKGYWAGALVLLGFLALGLTTFSQSMNPYLSFADARKSARTVQVMGALAPSSSRYDAATGTLHFGLVEEKTGERLDVAYKGVKPGNFEEAISIVAIGRHADGVFTAEKLLVKCPSKYQGQEVEKQYGGSKS